MRKLFIIFSMLIATVLVNAQDMSYADKVQTNWSRHYLHFGVGDNLMYGAFIGFQKCVYPIDYYYYSSPETWFGKSAGDTYLSQEMVFPVNFSLQYLYSIRHWLLIGGEVNSGYFYKTIRRSVDNDLVTSTYSYGSFAAMADARFQFLDRQYVGLYAGISLGVWCEYDKGSDFSVSFNCLPGWHLNLLGLRVGDKVFGTVELGWGMRGIVNLGIGTRF